VEKYTALVEGINIVSKHTKPTTATPQGGITKKEAPIHLSNLMLMDPKSGKPSRVGRKKDKKGNRRYTKDDIQKIRYVYHLVKEKGYTLEGAKAHLKVSKNKTLDN
jgi:large subunit ribosomal protein L24